jgi:glycosyltransferase involved in cell wall biosynthesis
MGVHALIVHAPESGGGPVMKFMAVSVVVPAFNRETLIVRSVTSALEAMQEGDELIVVDDGSTDNTEGVLAQFGKRIRFLRVPHGGVGPARNAGMDAARNDLIAFLDSDDEWTCDKLELQRTVMQARPEVTYCFSDFRVQDRHGAMHSRYMRRWGDDTRAWSEIVGPGFRYSSIAPLPPGREDFTVFVGDMYPALLGSCYVGTFTMMCRKTGPGGAVRYPAELAFYEDWMMFAQLAKCGPVALLDCETAVQHGHRGPRLTGTNELAKAESQLRMTEAVWGADPEFLTRYRTEYDAILASRQEHARFARAKSYLKQGRMREAREVFATMTHRPLKFRLALHVPGPVARAMLWIASATGM